MNCKKRGSWEGKTKGFLTKALWVRRWTFLPTENLENIPTMVLFSPTQKESIPTKKKRFFWRLRDYLAKGLLAIYSCCLGEAKNTWINGCMRRVLIRGKFCNPEAGGVGIGKPQRIRRERKKENEERERLRWRREESFTWRERWWCWVCCVVLRCVARGVSRLGKLIIM